MAAEVHEGDALEVLRATPDATYHGCLTDPPYGLSFMGHGWDHGVPSAEVWREVLRVMRPGAHLLAFGGTRTFHRLTCAIEDAGFEVRDVAMWMYGSGFPKSHDVSKAIDKANGDWRGRAGAVTTGNAAMGGPNYERTPKGEPIAAAAVQWSGYGTALKPAYEPILVARRPLEGTVAANVQAHGCGGLAIDACRVESGPDHAAKCASVVGLASNESASTYGRFARPREDSFSPLGRWPANVILDEEAGAALDAQSGERATSKPGQVVRRTQTAANIYGDHTADVGREQVAYGDSGGASRFFYCAKASRAERNAGCEALPYRWEPGDEPRSNRSGETRPIHGTNSTSGNTTANRGNIHPTVKPLALARYLARLILPPVEGARLLVPFCGSGSEVIGALQAGWAHVEGIDSWDVAVRIARARIAHHIAELAHVGT